MIQFVEQSLFGNMDREQENDSIVSSSPEAEETRRTGEQPSEEDSDDSLADIRYLEQLMTEITERQERNERSLEQDPHEIRAEDFVELPRDEPDFWHSITAQVNRVREQMRAVGEARREEEDDDDVRREIRERVENHWRDVGGRFNDIVDDENDDRWAHPLDPFESISDYEDELDTQMRRMNLQNTSRQNAVAVLYNSAGEEIYTSDEE